MGPIGRFEGLDVFLAELQVHGLEGRLEVFELRGADDRGGHRGLRKEPSQGDLGGLTPGGPPPAGRPA